MATKRITLVLIILLSLFHWQMKPTNSFAQEKLFINNVADWAYQLQGYFPGLVSIKDSKFDLIVMDYSFSGGPEDEISNETIKGLKFNGSCKRKIILAYMSIGEAEKFRFYYNNIKKEILFDKPEPGFPDNIKIRFWSPEWQKFIFGNQSKGLNKSYLDRIIDAGFDGVYLDNVDAYKFWGPAAIGGNGERNTAAKDMVDLVVKIADYARKTRGKTNFLIVPQNGAGIIDPSSFPFSNNPASVSNIQQKRYFDAIDAIGAENTFHFGDKKDDNTLNIQSETIKQLNKFRDAGKKVLAVDYVQSVEKVDLFYSLAKNEKYIPYATVRKLNKLTINSMHEPVCNNTLTSKPTPPVNTSPANTPKQPAKPRKAVPPVTAKTTTTTTTTKPPGQVQFPKDGRKILFKCRENLFKKLGDIDVISIRKGETIRCKLIVHPSLLKKNKGKRGIRIATELKIGNKASIRLQPHANITNTKGELMITLTGVKKGIDWIAWAIEDPITKSDFSKKSYDSGNAWGIFVVVQ